MPPPRLLPPELPPLPPGTLGPLVGRLLGLAGLLLTPANDADAPGYDADRDIGKLNSPIDKDAARLAYLEREREARILSAADEAEYVALLAKVKGIFEGEQEAVQCTRPSSQPNATALPRGRVTRILPRELPSKQLALRRENEAALLLAQIGYDVEQNPYLPDTNKNPDYLIEGQVFDCYSPTADSPRSVWFSINKKVITGQTARVVLNLDDCPVGITAIKDQFEQYPIDNLEEVIVAKNGRVFHLLP